MDEKEFFVVDLEMGNVDKVTSLEEAMKLVQEYLDDGDLEIDDFLIFEGKQIKFSQKLTAE